jgi:hypothetical protein
LRNGGVWDKVEIELLFGAMIIEGKRGYEMFSILLSLIITAQTNVDVYVASNINAQEYKALVKAKAPVYYYDDDTALILNPKGTLDSRHLELVAQGVPKETLFIYIIQNSKDHPQSLPFTIHFKVLYQTKRFKLMQAEPTKLDEIKKYPLLKPLPPRPIIAQDKQSPAFPPPTGDPIIHTIVDRLKPDMVSGCMSELCSAGTRYTFARNFNHVTDYATSLFAGDRLKISNQTYNIQPLSLFGCYAMKEGYELANVYNVFANNGNDWDVYLPRMQNVLGSKYNKDGSHLQLSANNHVCWNTNPNVYHDWTYREVGQDYDFPDIQYFFEDYYKEGNEIWASGTERYFDTFHGVIFHSFDEGEDWYKTYNAGGGAIGRFPIGDGSIQRLFCPGGYNKIYYSDDGINWDYFSPPLPEYATINNMCGYSVLDPAGGPTTYYQIFVGNYGNRLITDDGGMTWTWIDDGYYSYQYEFYKVGFADGRLWTVGRGPQGSSTVLISDDYGYTWTRKNSPPGYPYALWLNQGNKDEAWVGGSFITHTTDGGETWQTYPYPTLGGNTALNIVAEKQGQTKPNELVIICAHLDDISEDPMYDAEGADDDASGCAAVMACAKIMSQIDTERTVQFVLFSGNEQPWNDDWCQPGSFAYSNQLIESGKEVVAVMNLDSIGYADTGVSNIYVSDWDEGAQLYDFIAECRDEYVPILPITNDFHYLDNTDVESFLHNNFVASLISEDNGDNYNPYIDWKTDRMDKISQEQVYLTTRLVLATALELAGCNRTLQPAPPKKDYFHVYPNPLRPSQGQKVITFAGLHAGDTVIVYDTTGMKIWTDTADTTLLRWAPNVTSGIYLYTVKSSSGNHNGKIAIIK